MVEKFRPKRIRTDFHAFLINAVGDEFELHDIFQEINEMNAGDVAADNIQIILERERLIPKSWRVFIFPRDVIFRPEDRDLGAVSGSFFIMDRAPPRRGKRVARGELHGTVSGGELLDLDIDIREVF